MRRTGLLHKATAWLLAAAMVFTTAINGDRSLLVQAANDVAISAVSEGYNEGAYVTWEPVTGADGYLVYVSQDQSQWTQLDNELVRNYGTYMRADALGLTAGTWYIKIEAATFNSAYEKIATVAEQIETVTVTEHDRSGFAWVNGTTTGAYNTDGSLKDGALVIYVTEKTKDKVSVVLGEEGSEPVVGIRNIFRAYMQGEVTKPLAVRFVGTVTDPEVLDSGDLQLEMNVNAKSTAGVTIEGVGDDATIRGFGIVLKNATNVEIRNLGFMLCDSVEGDNVSLVTGNDHIWVHNCDFFYGMPGSDSDQKKGDGMLDSKLSNYVTFSYNHFWDSGKSCLLGLGGESDEYFITYHHNWFDHSDSRHPRVRFYSAHVYNNYYDGNSKYGIGATSGCSIFAENNYFRANKAPMLISAQGSDSGTFKKTTTDANGQEVEVPEDGGIIKAYGNYMDSASQVKFVPYATETATIDGDDVDFDAYVASSRDEQVPETVVTKSGSNKYNNFDTAADFYTYPVTATADVPTVVMENAGRLNGGDFEFQFDNATDDTSSELNEDLKAALDAYTSKLVSVGGILQASVKVTCTVTFNPANGQEPTVVENVELNQPIEPIATPTVIPEGYVEFGYWMKDDVEWDFEDVVTGNMTLTAKWFTQAEADANKRGGTPIGEERVQHSMVDNGYGSPYFEIVGERKNENGKSATYEGYEGAQKYIQGRGRLIFDSNAYIKFETTTEQSLLVLMMDITKYGNVIVDGETVAPVNGIVEVTIGKGEHVLTSKVTSYLFGIIVVPGECVHVEEPEFEENEANISLNVGEDLVVGINTGAEGQNTVEGFTFTDGMVVEAKTKAVDGVSYSAQLKTGGLGSQTSKNVKFHAEKGAEFFLAAMSSSSASVRKMVLARENEDGTTTPFTGTAVIKGVATECTEGVIEIPSGDPSSIKLTIPETGDYYIWGSNGGVNIFAIKISYPNVYRITFESNGGTEIADAKVEYGNKLTKPADPAREGYAFDGWYTDAECTTAYDFNTVIEKKFTLYAKWIKLYTVTFDTNDGKAVTTTQVKEGGKVLAPTDPVRDGYVFTGWYTDAACTTKYDFNAAVTADITIYAGWQEKQPEKQPEKGMNVTIVGSNGEYVYTGSAIKPQIKVTNNGVELTEGVDYTVKYTNNVNASENSTKKPTITVTGKNNLAGKASATFKIVAKNLADADVIKGNVVTANVAKAVPVICYNGMVLKAKKDFTSTYTSVDESNGYFTVTAANGNYSGSAQVPVTIKSKDQLLKFKVAVKKEVLTYDGTAKKIGVTVTDAKSKEVLEENKHYMLYYTNNVNAGSAKVTVIGMGDYSGAVTKKFTIKPSIVMLTVDASVVNGKEYPYVSTGATLGDDLRVCAADGTVLVQGKDYKITYSGNKKVGRAKYTVTYLGNYKGNKPYKGTFQIKAAGLNGAKVLVGDKVSKGKKKDYVSAPVVSVNNVVLKKSDYTCSYYYDEALTQPVEQVVAIPSDKSAVDIYVKIEGKGNYAGSSVSAKYQYCAATYTDLSKAKITVVDANGKKISKVEYTGEELTPNVIVTIGSGKNAQVVPATEYTVSYAGNVNKGKATVMITGTGTGNYAGSKTATFSVVSKNVVKLFDNWLK